MDALSDVLRSTRLTGGLFLHAEFSEPWCLHSAGTMPENCGGYISTTADIIPYHYVLEGCLKIKVEGLPVVELPEGGVALFPRNEPHLLGSNIQMQPTPADHVVNRATEGGLDSIHFGGGGRKTKIVCGFLAGQDLDKNPAMNALPSMLHFEVGSSSADWLRSSFTFAVEEITAGHAGYESVMAKISELLFVDAVRRYVETLPDGQTGWLAGLRDPYLSKALALLHQRISHPWTVDSLGRAVGLSRSALADRFNHVIGVSPMQYLTQWRMQVAAQELSHSSKSILQIALEVGYESEAAFSRAFKRNMLRPPATWRRENR